MRSNFIPLETAKDNPINMVRYSKPTKSTTRAIDWNRFADEDDVYRLRKLVNYGMTSERKKCGKKGDG